MFVKQFDFSIEKRNSELGRSLNFLILPPLDTMSGEVKWQRSIGPYFGCRYSTGLVVVARKWRQDKSIIGVQQNPSEWIDRDSVGQGSVDVRDSSDDLLKMLFVWILEHFENYCISSFTFVFINDFFEETFMSGYFSATFANTWKFGFKKLPSQVGRKLIGSDRKWTNLLHCQLF